MIGASGFGSMMSNYFGRSGRCKRRTFEPVLPAKPARHALLVGSSYWGTRNRHPPTGHTPLDAEEKFDDMDNSRIAFWRSGIGGSDRSRISNLFARRSQGVTADFWYPSMRWATPAAGAQRVPKTLSKLRQYRSRNHKSKDKVKGRNP
jgi:hypothetical protein